MPVVPGAFHTPCGMTRSDLETALERGRARRRVPPPAVRRLLRERAGLTQSELARALGTTRPTVTRYETGTRTPRGETLLRYLDLLDRLAAEAAR